MDVLSGIQQLPRAKRARAGRQSALVGVGPHLGLDEVRRQLREVGNAGVPGRREISGVGVVGAFAEGDPRNQFRDQPVQVHVALAVGVGAHIHRHAIDAGGEIGAVVEVEAAQIVLVGLAAAGVRGDDHARHRLEKFPLAQDRPLGQFHAADHPGAGRDGGPDGVVALGGDDDAVHGRRRFRVGRQGGSAARREYHGPHQERATPLPPIHPHTPLSYELSSAISHDWGRRADHFPGSF